MTFDPSQIYLDSARDDFDDGGCRHGVIEGDCQACRKGLAANEIPESIQAAMEQLQKEAHAELPINTAPIYGDGEQPISGYEEIVEQVGDKLRLLELEQRVKKLESRIDSIEDSTRPHCDECGYSYYEHQLRNGYCPLLLNSQYTSP